MIVAVVGMTMPVAMAIRLCMSFCSVRVIVIHVERVAVNKLLQVLADDHQMSHRTQIRLKVRHWRAVTIDPEKA